MDTDGYYNSYFSVRVAVIPLGSSKGHLDTYVEALMSFKDLLWSDVASLVGRDSNLAHEVDWKNGLLHFQFRRGAAVDSITKSLSHIGAWCDTRIIIGVMDDGVEQDVVRVSREWNAAIEELSEHDIVHKTILVFNHDFGINDEWTIANTMGKELLSVCPPDGSTDAGTSLLDAHMQETLRMAAAQVFANLQVEFALCAKVISAGPKALTQRLQLTTYHDDLEPVGSLVSFGSSQESALQKRFYKRLGGRLNKRMGDLCLLVGAAGAAVKFYVQAIQQCKLQGDTVWLVSAQEGLLAALLLCLLHGPGDHVLASGR